MIEYYKKKSAEYYERARKALEENQDYEKFITEAQTYDEEVARLEAVKWPILNEVIFTRAFTVKKSV